MLELISQKYSNGILYIKFYTKISKHIEEDRFKVDIIFRIFIAKWGGETDLKFDVVLDKLWLTGVSPSVMLTYAHLLAGFPINHHWSGDPRII